jgi:hypothetical protein
LHVAHRTGGRKKYFVLRLHRCTHTFHAAHAGCRILLACLCLLAVNDVPQNMDAHGKVAAEFSSRKKNEIFFQSIEH